MIDKLLVAIGSGQECIYINLINCAENGPRMIRLLNAAGYYPDNSGPQRFYTLDSPENTEMEGDL
jgi:hypothetical protein